MHLLAKCFGQKLAAMSLRERDTHFRSLLSKSLDAQFDGWGDGSGVGKWLSDPEIIPSSSAKSLLRSFWKEAGDPLEEFETSGLLRVRQDLQAGRPFGSIQEFALFSAICEAESIFLTDFLPLGSHEERLTGALISILVQVARQYSTASAGLLGASSANISFFDLATDRAEALSGADVGIISRNIENGLVVIKAARLQVKKTIGSSERAIARAPFKIANRHGEHDDGDASNEYPVNHPNFTQLYALRSTKGLGYYLAYAEGNDTAGRPTAMCIVSSAEDIFDNIQQERKLDPTHKGQTAHIEEAIRPIPWSLFLGMGMMRRSSGYGLEIDDQGDGEETLQEAVRTLVGDGPIPRFFLAVDATTDVMDLKPIMAKLRDAAITPQRSSWRPGK